MLLPLRIASVLVYSFFMNILVYLRSLNFVYYVYTIIKIQCLTDNYD